jgi:hypothetical protein
MDPAQLQMYLALFSAAYQLGDQIYQGVKGVAQSNLAPTDYAALVAAWTLDVNESAKNAGIPPEPDVPLP